MALQSWRYRHGHAIGQRSGDCGEHCQQLNHGRSARVRRGGGESNATGQSGVASGGLVLSATENSALVNAGYVRIGTATTPDGWVQRVNGTPPAARHSHTAVWTGSELIIWVDTTADFSIMGRVTIRRRIVGLRSVRPARLPRATPIRRSGLAPR
jgi:hypothetical protein